MKWLTQRCQRCHLNLKHTPCLSLNAPGAGAEPDSQQGGSGPPELAGEKGREKLLPRARPLIMIMTHLQTPLPPPHQPLDQPEPLQLQGSSSGRWGADAPGNCPANTRWELRVKALSLGQANSGVLLTASLCSPAELPEGITCPTAQHPLLASLPSGSLPCHSWCFLAPPPKYSPSTPCPVGFQGTHTKTSPVCPSSGPHPLPASGPPNSHLSGGRQ